MRIIRSIIRYLNGEREAEKIRRALVTMPYPSPDKLVLLARLAELEDQS